MITILRAGAKVGIGVTVAYGAAYIAALLLAATVIFSRRDFK